MTIAAVLHLVLFAALALLPLRLAPRSLDWSKPERSIELEEATQPREAPRLAASAPTARTSASRGAASAAPTASNPIRPEAVEDEPADEVGVGAASDPRDPADRWSEPEPAPPGLELPAALPWSAQLDLLAPAAPTAPPRARPLPEGMSELAVVTAVRARDRDLGLGNPEEGIVARAVQLAGRGATVPKDTRFRVEIDLDAGGHVKDARVARASAGDEATWRGVVASIRASLGDRVQVGPDVRRAGGRVVVDAEVKHALVSGADDEVTVGACPTDPHTSGMWAAEPFFAIGGLPYGEYATGTCPLSDATNGQPRQIQVRTRSTTVLPGAPPPPATSMPKPWKPTRLPSIWAIIFG